MRFVYLAGPVTGLAYEDATLWRMYAQIKLAVKLVGVIDPTRSIPPQEPKTRIAPTYPDTLTSPAGIMTQAYNDVRRADGLLVNLDGRTAPSTGTAYELAWAFAQHKPVVINVGPVMLGLHPMLQQSGLIVHSLDEAIETIVKLVREY